MTGGQSWSDTIVTADDAVETTVVRVQVVVDVTADDRDLTVTTVATTNASTIDDDDDVTFTVVDDLVRKKSSSDDSSSRSALTIIVMILLYLVLSCRSLFDGLAC